MSAPIFTLRRAGVKSAHVSLFAETIADYTRLRDEHNAAGSEKTRFHPDGSPYTFCDWTEGDVFVQLHAPENYRKANL